MNWRAFLKKVYLWKFKVITATLWSLDILKAHAIVYFLLVNLYSALRFGLYFAVDELPLVEIELKKANCREKALKVSCYSY